MASLGYLPNTLAPHQVAMATLTFAILVAVGLRDACRLQSVHRVWWSEALAGTVGSLDGPLLAPIEMQVNGGSPAWNLWAAR